MKDDHVLNRPPDMETAGLRIWKGKKEDDVDEQSKKGIEIEHKGIKFFLMGFTVCTKKSDKDSKTVFAYKMKHDEKMILYHRFVDNQMTRDAIVILLAMAKQIGYELRNMVDVLEETAQIKELWGEDAK